MQIRVIARYALTVVFVFLLTVLQTTVKTYYDEKIYDFDPFARLDQNGVGQLVEMAVTKAKKVRNDISLGICGEHAGEPHSIEFCHKIGLNYVSCSPFRVPCARLAAAQAVIKSKNN